MRRSALEVFIFRVHSLFHCYFAFDLMLLFCVDFSGLCVNVWLDVGSNVAFFASSSARLLSSISICSDIHVIMIRVCGCVRMISSA
jgi:hypothetical protein